MSTEKIAKDYLNYLSKGQIHEIISLFHQDGVVISPLYGTMLASTFYKLLQEDTIDSRIKLKEIFTNSVRKIAILFQYQWTMSSNEQVVFDVVDILEFDDKNLIISLQIIYDTTLTREAFKKLKHSK